MHALQEQSLFITGIKRFQSLFFFLLLGVYFGVVDVVNNVSNNIVMCLQMIVFQSSKLLSTWIEFLQNPYLNEILVQTVNRFSPNVYKHEIYLTSELRLQQMAGGGSGLCSIMQVRFIVLPLLMCNSGPPKIVVTGSKIKGKYTQREILQRVEIFYGIIECV